jgi:hypothetical protein
VTAAVALANHPDRIVDLRRELRATMAASPLCDAAGFTQDVEAAYRDMWRRWCDRAPPAVRSPPTQRDNTDTDPPARCVPDLHLRGLHAEAEGGGRLMNDAETRPRIRVLHHMARTGGTVISQCLASMDSVILLSEIHPQGVQQFDPLAQAHTWFQLLTEDEFTQIKSHAIPFTDTIDLVRQRAEDRGKTLVIRDWTHLDFTAVPFLAERSYRLTTAEVLRQAFDVINVATVRHPIDQWLSLHRLSTMQDKINLEEFLYDCHRFAVTSHEIGILHYEEFTRNPDGFLGKLCERLDIEFDPTYRERWKTYTNITGDPSPARDIRPAPRREMKPGLIDRFAANLDYCATLDLLGYSHPE